MIAVCLCVFVLDGCFCCSSVLSLHHVRFRRSSFSFVIDRRPPGSTRTDPPFPYTSLSRLVPVSVCPASRPAPPFHERNTGNFRSEEHTSELQSLMRSSYAVFCLKKKQREKA